MHASSAWISFTTAADCMAQLRHPFVLASETYFVTFEELSESSDQKLFDKLSGTNCHVLSNLLPSHSAASQNYSLRPRIHNRELYRYTSLDL
jgi:hypothetical protein